MGTTTTTTTNETVTTPTPTTNGSLTEVCMTITFTLEGNLVFSDAINATILNETATRAKTKKENIVVHKVKDKSVDVICNVSKEIADNWSELVENEEFAKSIAPNAQPASADCAIVKKLS